MTSLLLSLVVNHEQFCQAGESDFCMLGRRRGEEEEEHLPLGEEDV